MKFYLYMLGRENIMENYKDCKKKVLEEVKQYNGVLWETQYEIYQLWYKDMINDKQFDKLCELSKGNL